LWWIYPITVVPTHFVVVALFDPVSFVVAVTQIGGNFALAVPTALALRIIDGKLPDFGQFRTLLRFMLLAGLLVPAVVNSLIILAHMANGRTGDFWLSWGQWMMATVFPAVTIPPVLVPAIRHVVARWQFDVRFLAELGIVSAALVVLGFVAFGAADSGWEPAMRLIPLPLLLWAAVRLGVGGAGVALLVLGVAIVVDALRLEGPFANGSTAGDIVALQAYLIAVSVPLMLLAALLEERRRTGELLRRSEERMAVVAASTETGLWQWDELAKELWLTDYCRSMFGFAAGSTVTPETIIRAVHPEDRAAVSRALKAALSSGETTPREFRVVRPDGGIRWFIVRTRAQFDVESRATLVSGVFQDITERVGGEGEAEQLTRRLLTLQDDERRSIARELHDSTAQHIVAADLQLGALRRRVTQPEEAKGLMDEIGASLREALKEIRTFTFLLQPPELENEDLSSVLRRYVEGFGRRTGLQTTLKISPLADQLPPEQRRAILRIVQESLTNVHRHAGATSVSVQLRCIAGRLHLVISDDGQGAKRLFEPANGERMLGVGIPGMTARIRQLGGKIEINSRPAGTTVHVAVPIAEPGEELQAEPTAAGG
jgi:PAS domain S-box-containing protein